MRTFEFTEDEILVISTAIQAAYEEDFQGWLEWMGLKKRHAKYFDSVIEKLYPDEE